MNVTEFWNWFRQEEERLFTDLDDHPNEILHEMITRLNDVAPDLALEASIIENGKRRLEVSADGDESKFPQVGHIVESAPKLSRWDIVAFRQPLPAPFQLAFGEQEMDTEQIFYLPYENEEGLTVVVYGPDFNTWAKQDLVHYGFILVDNLLGEYDCVTKVRYYDFKDIEEAEDVEELSELASLPAFLKWYHSEGKKS